MTWIWDQRVDTPDCYPYLGSFRISSRFGYRESNESYVSNPHYGIDLVGIDSKVIVSCTSGTVVAAGYSDGLGNRVWIDNADGRSSCVYCHLSKINVKVGQSVSPKDIIGIEGSTGNSTGSHLHFGISANRTHYWSTSSWIDPAVWFNFPSGTDKIGETFEGKGDLKKELISLKKQNVTQTESIELDGTYNLSASGEYYVISDLTGTSKDYLFGRRYRVIVDLGDNALDVSDLRCKFECVKSIYNSVDYSTVEIYNLSPETENKIIQSGQRIIIEAGYLGSQYGVIYEGQIVQPIRSKERGVDYKLTLISLDSYRYQIYPIVSLTNISNQTARTAIQQLTTKAGDVTKENYGQQEGTITSQDITYPRGKVMFGNPTVFLNQIASSLRATYYNEDGTVNIVTAQDYLDDEIFDLTPESGLIGSPTQLENGVSATCLLNPLFRVNSLFHIDNSKVKAKQYNWGSQAIRELDSQGIYRIIKITHSGDTRGTGSDWITEIEAINQAGTMPAIAQTVDAYIW